MITTPTAFDARTATFVRTIQGFRNRAELFRLSEPVTVAKPGDTRTTLFVIVSAIAWTADFRVPETFVFPADESGQVIDWDELPGSFRGACDIDRALRAAGFDVIRPATWTSAKHRSPAAHFSRAVQARCPWRETPVEAA